VHVHVLVVFPGWWGVVYRGGRVTGRGWAVALRRVRRRTRRARTRPGRAPLRAPCAAFSKAHGLTICVPVNSLYFRFPFKIEKRYYYTHGRPLISAPRKNQRWVGGCLYSV
jgi:hypothetical protein